MDKITQVTGTAIALPRSNVDTDQIIPAVFLKRVTKTGYDDALFYEWRKDPDYVKAYTALEDEFSLAAEMIRARANAGLTQEQLAQRMNTTQAVIARLESGRVKPSTRTLERLAHATGMKLRISFEPAPAR